MSELENQMSEAQITGFRRNRTFENTTLIARFCGRYNPIPLFLSSSITHLVLYFHSDSSENYGGFFINYLAQYGSNAEISGIKILILDWEYCLITLGVLILEYLPIYQHRFMTYLDLSLKLIKLFTCISSAYEKANLLSRLRWYLSKSLSRLDRESSIPVSVCWQFGLSMENHHPEPIHWRPSATGRFRHAP